MANIPQYIGRTLVDTNDPVSTYSEFTGLRNTVAAERLKEKDLVAALNVDIDNAGTIQRRAGVINRLAANVHSLWSNGEDALFASNVSLLRLNPDFTSTTVATGLSQGLRMRYVEVNGVVYLSNGAETGAYVNGAVRSWGIRAPAQQPQATAIPGQLSAGTYQYAITFEAGDLRESGTGLAGVIVLADDQGIHFNNVPASSDRTVKNVRLYLSPQNGDMLFYAASVTNGTTSFDFTETVTRLGNQLRTQFLDKPEPMQELAVWHGRIYGFQFELLKYTEQFNYEVSNPPNYIKLESAGKVIAPVTDGIFVATENNTWFYRGNGPEDFERIKKAGYGAIFGTMVYIEHEELGIVPMWESTQGKVIGTNDGQLKNVTRSNFVYASAPIGAGLFKQSAGINQYLSVLQG